MSAGRPLSAEIVEGLAALQDIRASSGPMLSAQAELKIGDVERLLRHLLNVLSAKAP